MQIDHCFSTESFGVKSESLLGEKRLFAAALEYAIRDLTTGNYIELKSALKWVSRAPSNRNEWDFIPFEYVLEVLELSASRQAKLNAIIEEAKLRRASYVKERKRLKDALGETTTSTGDLASIVACITGIKPAVKHRKRTQII